MHVATSNTNYILWFCFCLVQCNHMYSVAKLFEGILGLQVMPARDAPAVFVHATVRLLWLQLLLPLQSMPPSATDQTSLWPGSSHKRRGNPSRKSRATQNNSQSCRQRTTTILSIVTSLCWGVGGGGDSENSMRIHIWGVLSALHFPGLADAVTRPDSSSKSWDGA